MNKLPQFFSLLCLFSLLISFGCDDRNNKQTKNEIIEIEPTEKEEFIEIAEHFVAAFDLKSVQTINDYIISDIGFFVLDNPGAAIIPHYYTSWDEIAAIEGTYDVAQLNHMEMGCNNPVSGKKPEFSCDEEGWSETGCFYGKAESLKMLEMHDVLLEIGFIDKTHYDKAIESAKKIDTMSLFFIYNTETTLGFYFAKYNDSWILVCVDKVFPCSA